MKRILLLRHAKSDWSAPHGGDHERPLNERGRRAAATIGRYLSAIGQAPDGVVTSSAVRARTTVELAAAAGDWDCEVTETGRLYESSPEAVLAVIHEVPERVSRLLLAGHEPVWSATASRLIGGGRLKMVTAAVACIDLPAPDWRSVGFGDGILRWLVTPKPLQRLAG